ncbi:MAG: nucleotidyltransferase domain-containing protein [Anaerolineae bacterium]
MERSDTSTRLSTGLTEKRKEQALETAEACIRLLKERFGARRVIHFGSIAGQGPWHGRSDIDLAVEGVAPEEFSPAYSACRDLLPRGLELDLVPLEDAYPEMRARILGEVEMPDDPMLALQGLIEDELVALERVAREMEDSLAQCAQPPTPIELRAMASMLHDFYNGVERMFERIAIGLGEGLPRGEYWHVDLLNQMAEEQAGERPAVIDEPLRARLKDYWGFRRFFQHAYGHTLLWSKMRWKAENLSDTLTMLRDQLHVFFEAMS